MKTKTPITFLLPAIVLLLLLAQTGAAQQNLSDAQEARQALSNFPDAQVLYYVNARRVTNEALPRIMPPAKLREAFDEVKKNAGFDLTSIHYVIAGARFKEDTTTFQIPDVVFIIKGDFSADAILSAMRIAGQGMYTDETYGTRTLNVYDFNKGKKAEEATNAAPPPAAADSTAPAAEANTKDMTSPDMLSQMGFKTPQVAVTALDPNTILIGVTPYVKAAIDARDGGQGRLRPELLDLVTRQPNTLVSLVGEIPESVKNLLQKTGMPKNEELTKLVSGIQRVQTALTMSATDFGLHAVVGTDTAEHARALNGMLTMGINVLRGEIEKDIRADTRARRTKELPGRRAALAAVNALTNTTQENEIQLSTRVPQTTVAALVRSQTKPPVKQATTAQRPRGARRRR